MHVARMILLPDYHFSINLTSQNLFHCKEYTEIAFKIFLAPKPLESYQKFINNFVTRLHNFLDVQYSEITDLNAVI